MQEDISKIYKALEDQGKRIEQIYASVEKSRKYFLAVIIISIVLAVVPLIGVIYEIPTFMGIYGSQDQLNLGI